MSHPNTDQLLEVLRNTRLLDDDRLNLLNELPEASWGDTETLLRHAESQQWLTAFQLQEIREGRGASLAIGAYRLLEQTSIQPGYTIYQAKHPALPQPVTLRLIHPSWLAPADNEANYVARIQAACLVNHPHLANMLDVGQEQGMLFVVQESIDGCDLAALIAEMGAMPVSLACEYIRQAALAVQAAHERGIVHGSISPYTLMMTPVKRVKNEATGFVSVRPRLGAVVKVIDLATIPARPPLGEITYAQSDALGRVEYLPPERLQQSGPDAAADVYGLAGSLYFLLATQAPFAGSTTLDVMLQMQQVNPTSIETLRNDVPTEIVTLLYQCLNRDPAQRLTAAEFIAAILPHCEQSAMPAMIAEPAIMNASETFTQPGIPTAAMVADPYPAHPIAEAIPEVAPLVEPIHDHQPIVEPLHDEEHHHEEDQFTSSSSGPSRPRPRPPAKKSTAWVIAGLLLHGTAVLLIVGFMTNWFAFLRSPEKPDEPKIGKTDKNENKKKPKSKSSE